MRKVLLPSIAVLSLFLLPARAPAADPAKDLKSRDVKIRLEAVAAIERDGGKDAEKLLLNALKDRDWEVVERAAEALALRGGAKTGGPLMKLAVTGPVRRVRRAAARSLATLDKERTAAAMIVRQVSGDRALAACEALEVLYPAVGEDQIREALQRGLAAKEVPVRAAAARLVACLEGGERRKTLEALLDLPETSVRAAALDAVRERPDPDDVPRVVNLLHEKGLNDVLARRAIAALVAVATGAPPGEDADRQARRALSGAELTETPAAAARFARLAGLLGRARISVNAEGEEEVRRHASPGTVLPRLEHALTHESESARAAAVHALGLIATDDCLNRVAGLARADESGRVRHHALRAVLAARGVAHDETRQLAIDRLLSDPDANVRETAAVALATADFPDVVDPLVSALTDPVWPVQVCAAVSLGKTGDARGVEPLRALLTQRDWKLRGAALVGFGHQHLKATVPQIIDALGSDVPALKNTAWAFLRKMTTKDLPPQVKPWRAWWDGVKEKYAFPDREKEAKEAKKYGYAPTYRGVYEDLDVIVLQSRGDSIEKLLHRLAIAHRMTRAGQVNDAGVHPFAIFVSNCTGEVVDKDVEQLQWFVRTGGYMFCSCWALHYTVEKVCPGVVRKLPTTGQVLDNVASAPCPTESPYLDGVFDGVTRPIYVLYGAHLIEVLDPERCEVLIDSPQCADIWGEGNLACWFTSGHGVILDSANHFDLQGLERVDGLKTAEDRMGWAMDHMGLSYEDLRELSAKKVWGSRSKAAAEARDLSAFRFITNFVRQKRRVDR